MTTTKERGLIVHEGAGGFLNPPGHPEHTRSVQTDLRRRRENRGSMSLSYAVECDYLDDATRAAAQRALDSWKRPPLESPEVQDWIHNVLGYFRNSFRKAGNNSEGAWNVSNLEHPQIDPFTRIDDHAGVHFIRKYYPEFTPTVEHFAKAYWGKKPE